MALIPIIFRSDALLASLGILLVFGHLDRSHAEDTKPTLSPELISKAKEYKQANAQYIRASCDGGSGAEREQTKAVRDGLRADLASLITAGVDRAPALRGPLDAAANAGMIEDKINADPNASELEKAAASAKFAKAKEELLEVATLERGRIELQIAKEAGVALAARDACPEAGKAAPDRRSGKSATTERPRRSKAASAPTGTRANAPASIGVSIGGGGGGVGVTFGQ